jgi:uncharacterized protein
MPMSPKPLSEADLDRLEVLLEAEIFAGKAMRLDEVQAMLCAVVSAPQPLQPALWLPEVFGETDVSPEAPEVAEIVALLLRLHDDIAAALIAGETVAPILYPEDERCETYDYATWADAYVFGAGLAEDWYDLAGKRAEDLSELLEPMFILNGMLREDAEKNGERWFPPAEEARLIADIEENLPVVVQTLYNFWRNRRAGAAPVEAEAKPGRNDPCPCGSGRKFKQCCGRPDKLN